MALIYYSNAQNNMGTEQKVFHTSEGSSLYYYSQPSALFYGC